MAWQILINSGPAQIMFSAGGPPGPRGPQDLYFGGSRSFDPGEQLPIFSPVRSMSLTGAGVAIAVAPAAALAVFLISLSVQGAAPTTIGTVSFALGSKIGTVAMTGPAVINPGDVITVTAPNPADASLGGVSITLAGA